MKKKQIINISSNKLLAIVITVSVVIGLIVLRQNAAEYKYRGDHYFVSQDYHDNEFDISFRYPFSSLKPSEPKEQFSENKRELGLESENFSLSIKQYNNSETNDPLDWFEQNKELYPESLVHLGRISDSEITAEVMVLKEKCKPINMFFAIFSSADKYSKKIVVISVSNYNDDHDREEFVSDIATASKVFENILESFNFGTHTADRTVPQSVYFIPELDKAECFE